MTGKLAPNKKELINWEKKSVSDAERISKRLEGRAELEDAATTENTAQLRKPAAPTPSPQALNRLRKKIKEVYDEEDEEEGNTFFNINLLDNEEIYDAKQARARQEKETIRITQEQHTAGKLNAVMSANMAAKASPKHNTFTPKTSHPQDISASTSSPTRRQLLKQKKIPATAPNIPTPTDEETEENELAKLILKKSGRRTPTKRLSEHLKENTPQQNSGLSYDTGKEND